MFTILVFLCVTLYPSSSITSTTCFMDRQPDLLCDVTQKFTRYDKSNTPYLTGKQTYIYLITKIFGLITKQGELVAQVNVTIQMDHVKQNIGDE